MRDNPRCRFYRSTILRLLGTYGTIIVLVVMLAAFTIAEPGTFATIGNFRNILNDMAIGTIVAGGLTVPLVAGDFDLSIGYVASFCGLLLVGLLSFNQLPIPVAMLIVIVIGTVIGVVNGMIVSKLGVNAFIATLGTGTVVVGLNYAYSGGIPLQLTHSRDFTDLAIGRLWGVPHLVLHHGGRPDRSLGRPQPDGAGSAYQGASASAPNPRDAPEWRSIAAASSHLPARAPARRSGARSWRPTSARGR